MICMTRCALKRKKESKAIRKKRMGERERDAVPFPHGKVKYTVNTNRD